MPPFLILVKAVKNDRVYDEVLLEFKTPPSEKKMESEIHFAELELKKHLNIRGLEFRIAPMQTIEQAKRSKLWNYGGHHLIVR